MTRTTVDAAPTLLVNDPQQGDGRGCAPENRETALGAEATDTVEAAR